MPVQLKEGTMSILTLRNIFTGLMATVTMDALSGAAYGMRLTAPLPPNLVGRWFAWVARARPFHADIARAASFNHETAIALPVHYVIGITLALIYLTLTASLGVASERIVPALAFGLATNVFPWLLMFPAMGYGFFGTQGPEGTRLLVSSLINHAFYGI